MLRIIQGILLLSFLSGCGATTPMAGATVPFPAMPADPATSGEMQFPTQGAQGTLNNPGVPVGTPVFSQSGTRLTIYNCSPGQSIFYRTDGGPVTIASPQYSGALTVTTGQQFAAICATVGAYQTNVQADLPSAVCYDIAGATETGNGTPCANSGGGIGTLAFDTVFWNVASSAVLTAKTQATAASSTQMLAEHLFSGTADPSPAKCDSCTTQVQDFTLTASAGSSTFINVETDMPQYDATHGINRQNGWQCNQQSGTLQWQADAGPNSGGWSNSGIACSYAAGVPHEIILRVTHVNGDTSCGGFGTAQYTDLWDNGVHHDLTGIVWSHCQGYGSTTFGAWGMQTQPDFHTTSGTALTGTLTLSSATVALGTGDESIVVSYTAF